MLKYTYRSTIVYQTVQHVCCKNLVPQTYVWMKLKFYDYFLYQYLFLLILFYIGLCENIKTYIMEQCS